jgi:hypothetical protein
MTSKWKIIAIRLNSTVLDMQVVTSKNIALVKVLLCGAWRLSLRQKICLLDFLLTSRVVPI